VQSTGLRDQSHDEDGYLFLQLGPGPQRTPVHHKFTKDSTPTGGDEQRTELDPGQNCDAPRNDQQVLGGQKGEEYEGSRGDAHQRRGARTDSGWD
jgi:hypothetical protein